MAAKETRADFTEMARLAGEVLKAADGISDALRTGRDSFTVPVAAFGNSPGGPAVHSAHEAVTEQGGSTIETLVGVLEGDVDRIYRVAFAYRQADQEAAHRLCRVRPMGGPTPC